MVITTIATSMNAYILQFHYGYIHAYEGQYAYKLDTHFLAINSVHM